MRVREALRTDRQSSGRQTRFATNRRLYALLSTRVPAPASLASAFRTGDLSRRPAVATTMGLTETPQALTAAPARGAVLRPAPRLVVADVAILRSARGVEGVGCSAGGMP